MDKFLDTIIKTTEQDLLRGAKYIATLFLPGFLTIFVSFKDKFYELDTIRLILISIMISTSIYVSLYFIVYTLTRRKKIYNIHERYYLHKYFAISESSLICASENEIDSNFPLPSDIELAKAKEEALKMHLSSLRTIAEMATMSISVVFIGTTTINILVDFFKYDIFNSRIHFIGIFVIYFYYVFGAILFEIAVYRNHKKYLNTQTK